MNFQKLTTILDDAKAEGEQNHTEAVKRISHLIYRDGDGNLVTIPED
jgi:hypothetical protein